MVYCNFHFFVTIKITHGNYFNNLDRNKFESRKYRFLFFVFVRERCSYKNERQLVKKVGSSIQCMHKIQSGFFNDYRLFSFCVVKIRQLIWLIPAFSVKLKVYMSLFLTSPDLQNELYNTNERTYTKIVKSVCNKSEFPGLNYQNLLYFYVCYISSFAAST